MAGKTTVATRYKELGFVVIKPDKIQSYTGEHRTVVDGVETQEQVDDIVKLGGMTLWLRNPEVTWGEGYKDQKKRESALRWPLTRIAGYVDSDDSFSDSFINFERARAVAEQRQLGAFDPSYTRRHVSRNDMKIAVMGPRRHGKTTFSYFLRDNWGFNIASVSDLEKCNGSNICVDGVESQEDFSLLTEKGFIICYLSGPFPIQETDPSFQITQNAKNRNFYWFVNDGSLEYLRRQVDIAVWNYDQRQKETADRS